MAEEKVRKRSLKDRLAEYKAGRHLGVPFNVEVREVDGAPVVHVNGNPEPELAISSRDRPDLNVSEALAEGAKSGDGGEFVLFRREGKRWVPELGLVSLGGGQFHNVTGAEDIPGAMEGTLGAGIGSAQAMLGGVADLLGGWTGWEGGKEMSYAGQARRREAHAEAGIGAAMERAENQLSPGRVAQMAGEMAPAAGLAVVATRGLGGLGVGDTTALGIVHGTGSAGYSRSDALELFSGLTDKETGEPVYPPAWKSWRQGIGGYLLGSLASREAKAFWTGRLDDSFGPPGTMAGELSKGVVGGGSPLRGATAAGTQAAAFEIPEETGQLATLSSFEMPPGAEDREVDPDASTYLKVAQLAAGGGFAGGAALHAAANVSHQLLHATGTPEKLRSAYEDLRRRFGRGGSTMEGKMLEAKEAVDGTIDISDITRGGDDGDAAGTGAPKPDGQPPDQGGGGAGRTRGLDQMIERVDRSFAESRKETEAKGAEPDDQIHVIDKQGDEETRAAREADIDKRFNATQGRLNPGQETGQTDIKRGQGDDPVARAVADEIAAEQAIEKVTEDVALSIQAADSIPEQAAKAAAKMRVQAALNFHEDPDSVFEIDSKKQFEERSGMEVSHLGLEADKVALWHLAKQVAQNIHPEMARARTVIEEVDTADPTINDRRIRAKRGLVALAKDRRQPGDSDIVAVARVGAGRGGVSAALSEIEMDMSQMRLGHALARGAPLLAITILEEEPDISPEDFVATVVGTLLNKQELIRPEMAQMVEIGGFHKFMQMLEGPLGDKYRSLSAQDPWPHRVLRTMFPQLETAAWPVTSASGKSWMRAAIGAKGRRDSENAWFDQQLQVPRGNEEAKRLVENGDLALARYVLDRGKAVSSWKESVKSHAAARMVIANRMRIVGEGGMFEKGLDKKLLAAEDPVALMWNMALRLVDNQDISRAMDTLGYPKSRAFRAKDLMPLMPVFLEAQVFRNIHEQSKFPVQEPRADIPGGPAEAAGAFARREARGGMTPGQKKKAQTDKDPDPEALSEARRKTLNKPEAGIKQTVQLFRGAMGRDGRQTGGQINTFHGDRITSDLAREYGHTEAVGREDLRAGDEIFFGVLEPAGAKEAKKAVRGARFHRVVSAEQADPTSLLVDTGDENFPVEPFQMENVIGGKIYRKRPPVEPVGMGAHHEGPEGDTDQMLGKLFGAPEPQHIERAGKEKPTVQTPEPKPKAKPKPKPAAKAEPKADEPKKDKPKTREFHQSRAPAPRKLSAGEIKSLEQTGNTVDSIWAGARTMKAQFPGPPSPDEGAEAAIDYNAKEALFDTIRSGVQQARAEIKAVRDANVSPSAYAMGRIDSAVQRAVKASDRLRKRIDKDTGVDQVKGGAPKIDADALKAAMTGGKPPEKKPEPAPAPAAAPAAAAEPVAKVDPDPEIDARIEAAEARLQRLLNKVDEGYDRGMPTEESLRRDQQVQQARTMLRALKARRAGEVDLKTGGDEDILEEIEGMIQNARQLDKKYRQDPRSKDKASRATTNFAGVLGRTQRRVNIIGDLLRYGEQDRAITVSEKLMADHDTVQRIAWNGAKGKTEAKAKLLQDVARRINAAVRQRQGIEEVQKLFEGARDSHRAAVASLMHEIDTGKDDGKLNLEAYTDPIPPGQEDTIGAMPEAAVKLAGSMSLEAAQLAQHISDMKDGADYTDVLDRLQRLKDDIGELLPDVRKGEARRLLEALQTEYAIALEVVDDKRGGISWLEDLDHATRLLLVQTPGEHLMAGRGAAAEIGRELRGIGEQVVGLINSTNEAIDAVEEGKGDIEEMFQKYNAAVEKMWDEKGGVIDLLDQAATLSEKVFTDDALVLRAPNAPAHYRNRFSVLSGNLRDLDAIFTDEDASFGEEQVHETLSLMIDLGNEVNAWASALASAYALDVGKAAREKTPEERKKERNLERSRQNKMSLHRQYRPRVDRVIASANELSDLAAGAPELGFTLAVIRLKIRGLRGALDALAKNRLVLSVNTYKTNIEASLSDLGTELDTLLDYLRAGGNAGDLKWDRTRRRRGPAIKWPDNPDGVFRKGLQEFLRVRASLHELIDTTQRTPDLMQPASRSGLLEELDAAMKAGRGETEEETARNHERLMKMLRRPARTDPLTAAIVGVEKRMSHARSLLGKVPSDKEQLGLWIDNFSKKLYDMRYYLKQAWSYMEQTDLKLGQEDKPKSIDDILEMADNKMAMSKNRAAAVIREIEEEMVPELGELAQARPDDFADLANALRDVKAAAQKVESARKPHTAVAAMESLAKDYESLRMGLARVKESAGAKMTGKDKAAMTVAQSGEGGKAADLTEAEKATKGKRKPNAKTTKSQRADAKRGKKKTKSQRADEKKAAPQEPEGETFASPMAKALVERIDPQITALSDEATASWDKLTDRQQERMDNQLGKIQAKRRVASGVISKQWETGFLYGKGGTEEDPKGRGFVKLMEETTNMLRSFLQQNEARAEQREAAKEAKETGVPPPEEPKSEGEEVSDANKIAGHQQLVEFSDKELGRVTEGYEETKAEVADRGMVEDDHAKETLEGLERKLVEFEDDVNNIKAIDPLEGKGREAFGPRKYINAVRDKALDIEGDINVYRMAVNLPRIPFEATRPKKLDPDKITRDEYVPKAVSEGGTGRFAELQDLQSIESRIEDLLSNPLMGVGLMPKEDDSREDFGDLPFIPTVLPGHNAGARKDNFDRSVEMAGVVTEIISEVVANSGFKPKYKVSESQYDRRANDYVFSIQRPEDLETIVRAAVQTMWGRTKTGKPKRMKQEEYEARSHNEFSVDNLMGELVDGYVDNDDVSNALSMLRVPTATSGVVHIPDLPRVGALPEEWNIDETKYENAREAFKVALNTLRASYDIKEDPYEYYENPRIFNAFSALYGIAFNYLNAGYTFESDRLFREIGELRMRQRPDIPRGGMKQWQREKIGIPPRYMIYSNKELIAKLTGNYEAEIALYESYRARKGALYSQRQFEAFEESVAQATKTLVVSEEELEQLSKDAPHLARLALWSLAYVHMSSVTHERRPDRESLYQMQNLVMSMVTGEGNNVVPVLRSVIESEEAERVKDELRRAVRGIRWLGVQYRRMAKISTDPVRRRPRPKDADVIRVDPGAEALTVARRALTTALDARAERMGKLSYAIGDLIENADDAQFVVIEGEDQGYSHSVAAAATLGVKPDKSIKELLGKSPLLARLGLWRKAFSKMTRKGSPSHADIRKAQDDVMSILGGNYMVSGALRAVYGGEKPKAAISSILSLHREISGSRTDYEKLVMAASSSEAALQASVRQKLGGATAEESFEAAMASTLAKRQIRMSVLHDKINEYLGVIRQEDHGQDPGDETAEHGSKPWVHYMGMMLVDLGTFLANNETRLTREEKDDLDDMISKNDWLSTAEGGIDQIRSAIHGIKNFVKNNRKPFPQGEAPPRTHDFELRTEMIRSQLINEYIGKAPDDRAKSREEADKQQAAAERESEFDEINSLLRSGGIEFGPSFKLWGITMTGDAQAALKVDDDAALGRIRERVEAELSARRRAREGAKVHYKRSNEMEDKSRQRRMMFGHGQGFGRGARLDKGVAEKSQRKGYHMMDPPRKRIVDQIMRDPEKLAGLQRLGKAIMRNQKGFRVRVERGEQFSLIIEGEMMPIFYADRREEIHGHVIAALALEGYTSYPIASKKPPKDMFDYGDNVIGIDHARDGHVRHVVMGRRVGEVEQDGMWAGVKVATTPVALDRAVGAIGLNKAKVDRFEKSELGRDLIRVFREINRRLRLSRELRADTLANMRKPLQKINRAKARAASNLQKAEILYSDLEGDMASHMRHLERMEDTRATVMEKYGLTDEQMDSIAAAFDDEAAGVFHDMAQVRREIAYWQREAKDPSALGVSKELVAEFERFAGYANKMIRGLVPLQEMVSDTIAGVLSLVDYPWEDWHVRRTDAYKDIGFGGFVATRSMDDIELADSLPDIKKRLSVEFDPKNANPVRVINHYVKRYGMRNTQTLSRLMGGFEMEGVPEFPVSGDYIMMYRKRAGGFVMHLETDGRDPVEVLRARNELAEVDASETDIMIGYYTQAVGEDMKVGPTSAQELAESFRAGRPARFNAAITEPSDMFWSMAHALGMNDMKRPSDIRDGDEVMVFHRAGEGSDTYEMTVGPVDSTYKGDDGRAHIVVAGPSGNTDISHADIHGGVVGHKRIERLPEMDEEVSPDDLQEEPDLKMGQGDDVVDWTPKINSWLGQDPPDDVFVARDIEENFLPENGNRISELTGRILQIAVNGPSKGLEVGEYGTDALGLDNPATRYNYARPTPFELAELIMPKARAKRFEQMAREFDTHPETAHELMDMVGGMIEHLASGYAAFMKKVNVPISMILLLRMLTILDPDSPYTTDIGHVPRKRKSDRAKDKKSVAGYKELHSALQLLFRKFPYVMTDGSKEVFSDSGVSVDPKMYREATPVFCAWNSFHMFTGDDLPSITKKIMDKGYHDDEHMGENGYPMGVTGAAIEAVAREDYGLAAIHMVGSPRINPADMTRIAQNSIVSIAGHIYPIIAGVIHNRASVHPEQAGGLNTPVHVIYVRSSDAHRVRQRLAERGFEMEPPKPMNIPPPPGTKTDQMPIDPRLQPDLDEEEATRDPAAAGMSPRGFNADRPDIDLTQKIADIDAVIERGRAPGVHMRTEDQLRMVNEPEDHEAMRAWFNEALNWAMDWDNARQRIKLQETLENREVYDALHHARISLAWDSHFGNLHIIRGNYKDMAAAEPHLPALAAALVRMRRESEPPISSYAGAVALAGRAIAEISDLMEYHGYTGGENNRLDEAVRALGEPDRALNAYSRFMQGIQSYGGIGFLNRLSPTEDVLAARGEVRRMMSAMDALVESDSNAPFHTIEPHLFDIYQAMELADSALSEIAAGGDSNAALAASVRESLEAEHRSDLREEVEHFMEGRAEPQGGDDSPIDREPIDDEIEEIAPEEYTSIVLKRKDMIDKGIGEWGAERAKENLRERSEWFRSLAEGAFDPARRINKTSLARSAAERFGNFMKASPEFSVLERLGTEMERVADEMDFSPLVDSIGRANREQTIKGMIEMLSLGGYLKKEWSDIVADGRGSDIMYAAKDIRENKSPRRFSREEIKQMHIALAQEMLFVAENFHALVSESEGFVPAFREGLYRLLEWDVDTKGGGSWLDHSFKFSESKKRGWYRDHIATLPEEQRASISEWERRVNKIDDAARKIHHKNPWAIITGAFFVYDDAGLFRNPWMSQGSQSDYMCWARAGAIVSGEPVEIVMRGGALSGEKRKRSLTHGIPTGGVSDLTAHAAMLRYGFSQTNRIPDPASWQGRRPEIIDSATRLSGAVYAGGGHSYAIIDGVILDKKTSPTRNSYLSGWDKYLVPIEGEVRQEMPPDVGRMFLENMRPYINPNGIESEDRYKLATHRTLLPILFVNKHIMDNWANVSAPAVDALAGEISKDVLSKRVDEVTGGDVLGWKMLMDRYEKELNSVARGAGHENWKEMVVAEVLNQTFAHDVSEFILEATERDNDDTPQAAELLIQQTQSEWHGVISDTTGVNMVPLMEMLGDMSRRVVSQVEGYDIGRNPPTPYRR